MCAIPKRMTRTERVYNKCSFTVPPMVVSARRASSSAWAVSLKQGASYLSMICKISMCVVSSTPLVVVHSLQGAVGGPRQDINVIAPTMACLSVQCNKASFGNWRQARSR